MTKLIDITPIVGHKYEERVRERKLNSMWDDLNSMSMAEFEEKYKVVSAGPNMTDCERIESEVDFEEENEEFEQLTDEDLK